MPTTYLLDRTPPVRTAPPVLDASQQLVVDHAAGPLLVLAGPGTGKTTTLVETVVDKIGRQGLDPSEVIVLTFSRKAAEHLRDMITTRLGRTLSAPIATTFHSFAYGLIRLHQPPDTYDQPLRLLSAAEQDVVIRELLNRETESVAWPERLASAVGTRGFTGEVQSLMSRVRERGLEAVDLAMLAEQSDHPEWSSAAAFLDQYLTVLDSSSALDYAELIHRAIVLAEQPDNRAALRATYRWVLVDEYQDTDPSQVRLLRALAGDGRNLIVVGDPDQSIYGFRGADVRGILDFPDAFRTPDGAPAGVVALASTRRFGSRMLRASRAIVAGVPASGSIPADVLQAFRSPSAAADVASPGSVEVLRFDSERAEHEQVADLLRRAHLDDGIEWSQMAVLVRSGRTMIPGLRRSLDAAGVPVEVASDDTPLIREPAVVTLLDALRAAVNFENRDPSDPGYLDASRAVSLLQSPLGHLDARDVRSLARQLRGQERSQASQDGRTARPSPVLVRAALFEPGLAASVPGPQAAKVARLSELLISTRAMIAGEATAEDVLWHLWSSTSWPSRLRAAVEAGGGSSRLAHRDLDAVCALFETAAHAEEQRGHTSVVNFLESLSAQQIPADTLAERGIRSGSVRVLTAHRSKGLEWRLVVVAHVQEGSWPDLRRRSSLLQADRVGADGVLPEATFQAMLAEERRLFYVACTRSQERLVVTAVKSPEDDGDQPSRFLDQLGIQPVDLRGRPYRPMSLAGLVAELRRTAVDPSVSESLRAAAVRRLARLATQTHHGEPLVPSANPARWWGIRARTRSGLPLRPVDEPVAMSASMLEKILECPARWFLEREAGGAKPSSAAQGFGLLVHALADRVAKGELSTVEEMMSYVDDVWGELVFRTPWSGGHEHAAIADSLARFLRWHHRDGSRTVIATEREVGADVRLPSGDVVRLTGYVDRLEIDAAGEVWIVDLKTGKYPPTDASMATNSQLGLYQLAVDNGAIDDLVAGARAGGAELVHVRKGETGLPKVQAQRRQVRDADGQTAIERQLQVAVDVVRSERFPARAGTYCERCDFQAICPAKSSGTVLS